MNEEPDAQVCTVLLTGFEAGAEASDGPGPAARLRTVLDMDERTAQKLLDNMPAVLARGIPEDVAREYATRLREVGAQVVVRVPEAEGEEPTEAEPALPARANDPFEDMPPEFPRKGMDDFEDEGVTVPGLEDDEPQSNESIEIMSTADQVVAANPTAEDDEELGIGEVRCPRCGRRQPASETCFRCGIMFAKYGGSGPAQPRRASVAGAGDADSGAWSAPAGRDRSGVARAYGRAGSTSRSGPAEAPASDRPPAFWPSIPSAFAAPFLGSGIIWIPLLLGVLFVSRLVGPIFGVLMLLAYLGLLANYFAGSVGVGIDGDVRAPAPPHAGNVKANFIMPGVAVLLLSIVLFSLPLYATLNVVAVPLVDEASRAALLSTPERWDPDETFIDGTGLLVSIGWQDDPVEVRRVDGTWVRVDPKLGTLTRLNAPEDEGGGVELPLQGLLLLVVAFAAPFFYWPMALTVAGLGGNVFRLFNPIYVASGVVRGGIPYIAVVLIGMLLLAVGNAVAGLVLAGVASAAGSPYEALLLFVTFSFGLLGYAAGVQGHLMGRLIASRPRAFRSFRGTGD